MFQLTFATDNVAFGEGGEFEYELRLEASRILRKVAGQILDGRDGGPVMDVNGNTVGKWSLRP